MQCSNGPQEGWRLHRMFGLSRAVVATLLGTVTAASPSWALAQPHDTLSPAQNNVGLPSVRACTSPTVQHPNRPLACQPPPPTGFTTFNWRLQAGLKIGTCRQKKKKKRCTAVHLVILFLSSFLPQPKGPPYTRRAANLFPSRVLLLALPIFFFHLVLSLSAPPRCLGCVCCGCDINIQHSPTKPPPSRSAILVLGSRLRPTAPTDRSLRPRSPPCCCSVIACLVTQPAPSQPLPKSSTPSAPASAFACVIILGYRNTTVSCLDPVTFPASVTGPPAADRLSLGLEASCLFEQCPALLSPLPNRKPPTYSNQSCNSSYGNVGDFDKTRQAYFATAIEPNPLPSTNQPPKNQSN